MTAVAFPKPVRAPKKPRKPIQRKARLQARSWGVSNSKSPARAKAPSAGFTPAHGLASPRGGVGNSPALPLCRSAVRERRTETRPKPSLGSGASRSRDGGERPAFPKPEKKTKRRHWGVSRGPSKTAYGRRERGLGRMAFIRSLPCGVPAAFLAIGGQHRGAPFPGPCDGGIQCMHLGWKADPGGRRKPGDTDTAPGCELHHAESGTKLGGLGEWYVALGRDGQRALRSELVAQATAAWDALTPDARARWEEIAASRRRG